MPVQYRSTFYAVKALPPPLLARMQTIFLEHYEATSPALFQKDLREKDEVQAVFHGDTLVGFTTFLFYPFEWRGEQVEIVFSGDTVVAREHWGQQNLAFDWLGRMGRRQRQRPEVPLYWFLIVKGHRTYRYLHVFAKDFYPRFDKAEPELEAFAAALAQARFGQSFDQARGIISFGESHGQLAQGISEPTPAELKKEEVRFFLQKNPGYRAGDELVCLCRLSPENLRPLARRCFSGEPAKAEARNG